MGYRVPFFYLYGNLHGTISFTRTVGYSIIRVYIFWNVIKAIHIMASLFIHMAFLLEQQASQQS